MIIHTAMCDLCSSQLTGWSDRDGADAELAGTGWVTISTSRRVIHICRDHPVGTGEVCVRCDADLDIETWLLHPCVDGAEYIDQMCQSCHYVNVLGLVPYQEVP